jgi:hypothetical protein
LKVNLKKWINKYINLYKYSALFGHCVDERGDHHRMFPVLPGAEELKNHGILQEFGAHFCAGHSGWRKKTGKLEFTNKQLFFFANSDSQQPIGCGGCCGSQGRRPSARGHSHCESPWIQGNFVYFWEI